VACRRRLPQHQLLRVARTQDGPRFDELGTLPGRGAYLCDAAKCINILERREGKPLHRALRCGPDDDLTLVLSHLRAVLAPEDTGNGKEQDE